MPGTAWCKATSDWLSRSHAFPPRRLEMDDLVGKGDLGLLRAAQKYDPQFRTRFSTYATFWIKESIQHTTHGYDKHHPRARTHLRLVD